MRTDRVLASLHVLAAIAALGCGRVVDLGSGRGGPGAEDAGDALAPEDARIPADADVSDARDAAPDVTDVPPPTECGWGPPVSFGDRSENPRASELFADARGNGWLVYLEDEGVRAARFDAETRKWSLAELLFGCVDCRFTAGFDDTGHGVVAAVVADRIEARRFDPGAGAWAPADVVLSDASVESLCDAAGSEGSALVLWRRLDAQSTDLFSRDLWYTRAGRSGTSWSTGRLTDSGGGGAVCHASATLLDVPIATTAQPEGMAALELEGDGRWAARAISRAGAFASQGSSATSSNANVVTVWQELEGGFGPDQQASLWVNRRRPGGWGQPERIYEAPPGLLANVPQIAVADDGAVFVVWHETPEAADPFDATVRAVRFDASRRSWDDPVELGPLSSSEPRVGADARGSGFVVWNERYRQPPLTYHAFSTFVRRFDVASGAWSEKTPLSGSGHTPDVAVSRDGSAFASYHPDMQYTLEVRRYSCEGP